MKSRNIFEVDTFDSYVDRKYIDPLKLQQAKIGLQGSGGIGSYCSKYLCRMGIGYLEFCDGDRVELKNLPMQNFYLDQVGENKALASLTILEKECTGKSTLIAYPLNFSNVREIYPEAFSSISIFLSCVDNHKARYEAAEFGFQNKIPVVLAGVSENMKLTSVFIQIPKQACFNCFKHQYKNKAKLNRNKCRHLAVLPPHIGVVSFLLYTTIEIIMGRKIPWSYYYFSFEGTSISGNIEKDSRCELCGGI